MQKTILAEDDQPKDPVRAFPFQKLTEAPLRSLTFKLTLGFLLVSLTGIALVAVLVGVSTSNEFNQFVLTRGLNDYYSAASSYYNTHGSWTGVAQALQSQGLVAQNSPAPGRTAEANQPTAAQPAGRQAGPGQNPFGGSPEGRRGPPVPFVLVDQDSRVLVPTGPFQAGMLLPASSFPRRQAIQAKQHTVGYVIVTGRPPSLNPAEAHFLAMTNQALVIAAIGAGLLAIFLGLFLAPTITRPIRELTLAARALTMGNLNSQVPVRSKDELGELSQTFNQMSADLERSNRLRRQMTADIAHDLRTPLAVITGYLEGLKEGVLKPTPQRFAAMHDESLYLQRLVEDLRTLSLADAGELSINRQPVQPGDLIERLAAAYQHQAEQNQIRLKARVEDPLPELAIDPERMQQALGNLISNAMRYTPPEGEIVLSANQAADAVLLTVRDTGAGIAADVLPHVFDRFYRGDSSRQGDGSGLGLAITKSIVELQGGKITAASEGPGKGSLFTIWLPREED